MSVGALFENNPMLKFIFPLMAGIAFSYMTAASGMWLTLLLFAFSFVLACVAMRDNAPRWLFGVAVTLSMFLLGMLAEQGDRSKMAMQWSGQQGRFEAVLLDVPHLGERSAKVRAHVTRIGRDSLLGARREGTVNIYFANSYDAEALRIGHRIYFEGKVAAPKNSGNPAEFDARLHAYVNGVTGTVYLPIDGWRVLGTEKHTLRMKALMLREHIFQYFSGMDIGQTGLAVLAALTLGERSELTRGMRDYFATAGAGHLLALSGLHLGMFYMIFTFLLPVRKSKRWLVVVRELIVVAFLWCFALMAGLSPSIVRAALLFTLMSLARCMQRDNSSLNSLAFVALIMLTIYPRWLFDVGFQLSFSAVAAILLLQRPILRLLRADDAGRVYHYFAGVVAVSLAAQVGTSPFVWYYFGTFPLYFLITNIVVVPIAFVIMLLAVVAVAVMPVAALSSCVACMLGVVLDALNGFLRYVASVPYASLELPYMGLGWLLLFSGLFYFLVAAVVCRRKIAASVALALCVVAYVCYVLTDKEDASRYMLFYNNKEFPAVHAVCSKEKNYIVSSYPEWELSMQYVVEPYCRRQGLNTPQIITNDYSDEKIAFSGYMLNFAQRRVALLDDDCWLDETVVRPVDCVYLVRGFLGDIKELLLRYPSRYVVMDATLYASSRKRIARECSQLGVRCIDLTQGAVKMLCDKTGVRFVSMSDR